MEERIGNVKQLCGAYRLTKTDGTGKGQDLLLLFNGALTLLITLSHAGDILQLWEKGRNVSFITKNGLNNEQKDFASNFPGGMLYTCGLNSVGAREGYPLHGSIHHAPAEIIALEETETYVKVTMKVEDTALFGQHLVLTRVCTLRYQERSFTWVDTLTNRGFKAENYALLYHCNFGFPFVDEHSTIEGHYRSSFPRTSWAEQENAKRRQMESPVAGMEETCYFDDVDDGTVILNSPTCQERAVLHFDLPHLVEWKSRASGDYVIGLEPTTTHLDDRFTYQKLEKGESVSYHLELCFEDL